MFNLVSVFLGYLNIYILHTRRWEHIFFTIPSTGGTQLPPISTPVLYLHSHIYSDIYIYIYIDYIYIYIYILEINMHYIYIYKLTDSYNDISNVQCTDCTSISISISIYSISSSPPSPLRVSIRQADLLQSALETLKSQASEAQVPGGCKKKGGFPTKIVPQ